MAIIDELGLEVKVLIAGSEATEYIQDEEVEFDGDEFGPSTKTCCRYVESIDNAHFAIYAGVTSREKAGDKWIGKAPKNGLKFDISFDGGRSVATMFITQRRKSHTTNGIMDAVAKTKRKFQFAPVSTVDNANKQRIAQDLKTAKHLGIIRVAITRVTFTDKLVKGTWSYDNANPGEGGFSLAEKALKGKAISHGTTFSAPVKAHMSFIEAFDVDSTKQPFAVFYFKYRSKDALQQEMIIPRPRSLSVEPDVDNLSSEELRRLASERLLQMRGNSKRAASIKDENDQTPGPSRPYKFVRIEGGKKAIDLTEDD